MLYSFGVRCFPPLFLAPSKDPKRRQTPHSKIIPAALENGISSHNWLAGSFFQWYVGLKNPSKAAARQDEGGRRENKEIHLDHRGIGGRPTLAALPRLPFPAFRRAGPAGAHRTMG